MTTFNRQLLRDVAQQYGLEAVKIGNDGRYKTESGRLVEIKQQATRAVAGTRSYPPATQLPEAHAGEHETVIEVHNETTLSAGKRLLDAGYNTAVLNFASATHPGGGFLGGARAQEEYLARSSCLYHCIRDNPMYEFHRSRHDPIYTDYVIYSPQVPVFRGDDGRLLETPYTIGIITSPAVNASRVAAGKRSEIGPAMWRRIIKVLAVGVKHEHDAIVLGAWGCGAFANDGNEIARLFHKALNENFKGAYRSVVFAIVDWSAESRFIGPFEDVFGGARR